MKRSNAPRVAAAAVMLALANISNTLAQVLPPPPLRSGETLSVTPRLFVREFRFQGNTVFSEKDLAQIAQPFSNRELNTEDLERVRRAISLHYINRGYINSGAIIPDQDPKDGVVRITIVEGVLTKTELHGNRWLRDGYIERQLGRWSGEPLNMNDLQEGLQLLRQNPNIERINAELKPGANAGEGVLDLRIQDRHPFRVGMQIDNQRPPSVGEEELWLTSADLNLTGNSDPLYVRYGLLNGTADGVELSEADNLEVGYSFPVTSLTTIGVRASRLNTRLVEESFSAFDIKSLTTSFGVNIRQALRQTASEEIALSLGFDHRRNKTWLLDQRFNLSPGAEHGEMVVSALRFSQDWMRRGQNHVVALRSTFSFGLDIGDASDNGIPGEPNGEFLHWLGQAQYVQRLFGTQNELVLRASGQFSAERLLALEQFSVGGMDTVRGYLENQLVRDRGFVSSAEFRIPVLFNKAGAGILHVAPFFDFGGGWNVENSPSPTTIASSGIGVLFAPNKHVGAQFYWGYRFRDLDMPEDARAQGLGIHFRLQLDLF
jgi:hemolysin activation/secretion protein